MKWNLEAEVKDVMDPWYIFHRVHFQYENLSEGYLDNISQPQVQKEVTTRDNLAIWDLYNFQSHVP